MPSILFISEACLLDLKSGAAHAVRTLLKSLYGAGWSTKAVTMTLCDGDQEQSLVAVPADSESGSVIQIDDEGLEQQLYVCASSRHQALRPWERQGYQAMVRNLLADSTPDILLTYSSEALRPLLAEAQQRGARTVFYLVNQGYALRAEQQGFRFQYIDEFLVPSNALAERYLQAMDLQTQVVRDIVESPFDGRSNLRVDRIESRQQRWVTMINPEPAKGGLFFLNLVAQVNSIAPGIKFRVVESRWGKQEWLQQGADLEQLHNLEWVPTTTDMGKVYAEAALVLVPSLAFEASGRVAAEAMLAGVPVMAMQNGGLIEQLNGGGFLFPIPESMRGNYAVLPATEALQEWAQYIQVLLQDKELYTQAVRLALQAGQKHKPELCKKTAVELMTGLAEKPALASISATPALADKLADFRQRMNSLREAVNNSLDRTGSDSAVTKLDKELYQELLTLSLRQPALKDALAAVKDEDWDKARAILESYLRLLPEDVAALMMLGGVAEKQERGQEARHLLERVVELAPGLLAAHYQLLQYLRHAGDAEAALKYSFALLERAPEQPCYLALHAHLLSSANRFEEAIAVFEAFFRQHSSTARDWMQYALSLKTIGQQDAAVDAYRRAIFLAPKFGGAWHALSNMKLAVFTDADVDAMVSALDAKDLSDEDRYNIHFTLGKAYEDKQIYDASYSHYASANRIRRQQQDYDVGRLEDYVAQAKELFTESFFAEREGYGYVDKADSGEACPIFVMGLHRAGSTLTEQILASHSQIEGTRELPNMLNIGRQFGGIGSNRQEQGLNTELLRELLPAEFKRLGLQYLEETRSERHTERPCFVDKMPVNWMFAGLIHLLLPRAKMIDIRRDPMAATFALFKMNFGNGVEHAYDQSDIARYYMAYADLMAHFDKVLPGRIHHIRYENLVENTEAEIRRMIDYCGLPFEEQCLRYWETERAVQTPSSEQVRKPIYKGGLDQWQNYAPWMQDAQQLFGTRFSDYAD